MTNAARNAHDGSKAPSAQRSSFLCWVGASGIVTIAVMRCCVTFVPQVVFDTDPALDRSPIAALGMAGSLILDVALILCCLVALVGERRSGRGLDPTLLLLALLPAPLILWHGHDDAGNLWRGSTWLAAVIACVAIAHLARHRSMRIALTASLLAVVAPLLSRGAIQLSWEHDATVAAYQQNKDVILRMQGWESDSPAVRIYERRLMNREPTGWFPSTNIYGSILGATAVALAGLGWCAFAAFRRNRIQSGAWFLLGLLVIAGAGALWFTSSMGALLASGAGALMLIALLAAWNASGDSNAVPGRARVDLPPWAGPLMLAMIVGATAGVIVRGALLPEGFLGEKSLLFRWHYLRAAVGVIGDHPLLGAGPDGFQQAYTQHRPPRNPEEVQSAHAMFTDWLAMLGIAGFAWIAMMIRIVWSAGRPSSTESTAAPPRVGWFALVIVAAAIVPAIIIEWPALDERDLFMRGLMALGYFALAVFLASVLTLCDNRVLRILAVAAAVVLLVHGQIEMTFFQGGSIVWALAMVGLVGAPRPTRSVSARTIADALTVALLLPAGWILLRGAIPACAQERAMRDAAHLLDAVHESDGSLEVVLRQRPLAADALVWAYERWPANPQPLNAAAGQMLLAAHAGGDTQATTRSAGGGALGLLSKAEAIIDRAVAAHEHPSSMALAMNVHANLASAADDPEQWTRAIALGRRLAELDPCSVGAWQRLGRVLWAAGERVEAAKAYQRAIANSDNFDLDPQKQLSQAARTQLQSFIDQAGLGETAVP